MNWFGDSLDGTLARYRNRLRPRYGFYVDHIVDMYAFLALLSGLALSPYMSRSVAFGLLVVYYMLSIHIYLSTYTEGVFKIAYGKVGGTELRLIMIVQSSPRWATAPYAVDCAPINPSKYACFAAFMAAVDIAAGNVLHWPSGCLHPDL